MKTLMKTILMLSLVVALTLFLAVPAFAEDSKTPIAGEIGVISDPDVIPPIPPIPTRDQYTEGPTLQELAADRPLQEDGTLASDAYCVPAQWLKLTYYTHPIPDSHGGGTAEGYSGFHYGRLDNCKLYVQPVANSRVTYGGEIDTCEMEISVDRWKPILGTELYWEDEATRIPCNMNGARRTGPTDVFQYPVNKWDSRGYHYFEDQYPTFWYASGNTYTHLNY